MFRSKADKERIEELEGANRTLQSLIDAMKVTWKSQEQTIIAGWKRERELQKEIDRLKQGVRDVIDPKPAVQPVPNKCSCGRVFQPTEVLSGSVTCTACGARVYVCPVTPQVPRVPECPCRAAEAAAALRAARDLVAVLSCPCGGGEIRGANTLTQIHGWCRVCRKPIAEWEYRRL